MERANGAPDANASTRSIGFGCASSARAAPAARLQFLAETIHRARPVLYPTSDSGDVPTSDRSTPTQRPRPLASCRLSRGAAGCWLAQKGAHAHHMAMPWPGGRPAPPPSSLAFGSQFYYAIRAQIQPIGTYSTCVRPHVRTSSTLPLFCHRAYQTMI